MPVIVLVLSACIQRNGDMLGEGDDMLKEWDDMEKFEQKGCEIMQILDMATTIKPKHLQNYYSGNCHHLV